MTQQYTPTATQQQQYSPQQEMQPSGQGSMTGGQGTMTGQSSMMGQGTMTGGGQLPQQYRQALSMVAEAIQVCGWCADQCIQEADPHMIECIRLCEDVAELGETLLAMAPRSSPFTADLARTFSQAAQACAQECGQHQHGHCQECATVLPQAAQAVQQLSTTGGQQSGGQQFGGQQLSM